MNSIEEKFCTECGQTIKRKAEICPHCGCRQSNAPLTSQLGGGGRNRLIAGLLALFLGGLGIHKFYLGEMGAGVMYLLFCWTLIPAFLALINAIVLFSMREEVFNAKYNP